MKNKYVAGIITGALCAVVICSVVFSVIYRNSDMQQSGIAKDYSSEDNEHVGLEGAADELGEAGSTTLDGKKNEELLEKIDFLKFVIEKRFLYDVTEEQYEEAILKGMMEALNDPYSCYYTAEEYAEFLQELKGTYCGIGAFVSQSRDTNMITITKPIKDGPAEKVGILAGDIVYKVNKEEIIGLDLSTVVSMMRGEKGTKVEVTMLRGEDMKEIEFNITRDEISYPTVEYKMLEDNIGYISVLQFDEVTDEQFAEAIDDLETQGMKGLVIDVRDNGGGMCSTTVTMLDRLFEKDKLLFYSEEKNGTREDYYAEDDTCINVPLAVLINGYSASASEIFAGAIQDYKIGTVVGTQSFGKGIIQTLLPITDGSALKLTVSNYYTPSGDSIHKIGITPDVVVELEDELNAETGITMEEDNQLQAAIKEVKKQMK